MSLSLIIGCGDIGTRIAKRLGLENCVAIVSSQSSLQHCTNQGIKTFALNFDKPIDLPNELAEINQIYYLVPPQKQDLKDLRSRQFLSNLFDKNNLAKRIVLISTTGVYGDHSGDWVDETTPANPQTDRAKRRWDMEQQWIKYSETTSSIISTLRVPGIYSHSRLPRKRLEQKVPIVNPEECGFTNRIHADDLAAICTEVMQQQLHSDTYNATDGFPGKISEYLLAAAHTLKLPAPPIIPLAEAEQFVSEGMLSYLRESRKISNKKLLKTFDITLKYPNFKIGLTV